MAAPPPLQVSLARKYGRKYGVDPRLLLAIGGHETGWGTLGAGRQGFTLGYGATDSGQISKYAGVENQYRYGASTLASWGVKGLRDVIAGKASRWATDPAWERGIQRNYQQLSGQPLPAAPPLSSAPIGGGAPGTLSPAATPVPLPQFRATARQLASLNAGYRVGAFPGLGAPMLAPRPVVSLAQFVGRTMRQTAREQPMLTPAAHSEAQATVQDSGGWVDPATGKVIGTPGAGTHTLGDWASDRALDISVPIGTPIRAPFAGMIGSQFGSLGASSGSRFAGLRLHVASPQNEWYGAHLSRFAPGIKPGVRVRPGQIVGYSGSAAGVPHLHEALKYGDPYRLIR